MNFFFWNNCQTLKVYVIYELTSKKKCTHEEGNVLQKQQIKCYLTHKALISAMWGLLVTVESVITNYSICSLESVIMNYILPIESWVRNYICIVCLCGLWEINIVWQFQRVRFKICNGWFSRILHECLQWMSTIPARKH